MIAGKLRCVATGLFLLCATAAAQQAAERFVPIGMSPGVSGEQSTIGRITAVDRDARTVTVASDDGSRTFEVARQTRIWLDRSGWRLTNIDGTFYDCVVGRPAEVMYMKGDSATARWIKVKARELHQAGATD